MTAEPVCKIETRRRAGEKEYRWSCTCGAVGMWRSGARAQRNTDNGRGLHLAWHRRAGAFARPRHCPTCTCGDPR